MGLFSIINDSIKECKNFHEKVDLEFSDTLDEVVILEENAKQGSPKTYKVKTKCYRDEPGR